MTSALEVADHVLQLVGERAEAIVSVTRGTSALTRFANSVIHQNVAEDSEHVTLKCVIDGRSASATVNQVDVDTLERLVDRVLEAAELRPPDPDWPGLAPPESVAEVEHYDEATALATPGERATVVKAFVDAGQGTEAAGYCATASTTVALANTAGQRVEGRHSSGVIDGIHRARPGADGAGHQQAVSLAALDGRAAGEEAARRAGDSLTPIDLEPGQYEVVLEPACVTDMLRFLAYAGFNGKSLLEGTSFVHLGERQFDEAITLWDDATDARTVGLPFDHEGTPKRRIDLVRDGVTTAVAHDRRTAAQAGATSTGHSVGLESFGAYPANVFLGGGEASSGDLVASVERGLLVCGFWYTRILDPKTQVVTGLTRNGLFLIEDGKVGGAVRNLRFTQSYAAAFGPGRVLGLADDGRLYGGYHVPTVRLASFNFTGGARG